jgi:hypothetical protein
LDNLAEYGYEDAIYNEGEEHTSVSAADGNSSGCDGGGGGGGGGGRDVISTIKVLNRAL